MPSIVQNAKSGYFYAQFYDPAKRPARKRVPLRTRTRRTAERAFHRLSEAYALGDFDPWAVPEAEASADAEPILDLSTIGAACTAFLEARSHLRPRTLGTYQHIVRAFEGFLGSGFPVARITAKHVLDWLATTRARDITRYKYNHHLGYLFRFLVRGGYIKKDISKLVPLRKVHEQAPKAMTRLEVDALLAAIATPSPCRPFKGDALPPDRAWLYTLVGANVYLGLRRGELMHLRWSHVDFERRLVRVANTEEFTTKSGKERTLPLCESARELLLRLRQQNPTATFVFEASGKRIQATTMSVRFKIYLRRARLPDHYNVHSTRHTFGTWLAEHGVPLHVLQRLMGHCSVVVTERYVSWRPEVAAPWVQAAFDGPRAHGPM